VPYFSTSIWAQESALNSSRAAEVPLMWSPTSTDCSGPTSRNGDSAPTASALAMGLPKMLAGTDSPTASAPTNIIAPSDRRERPAERFERAFLVAFRTCLCATSACLWAFATCLRGRPDDCSRARRPDMTLLNTPG
jgi:hypothetical protein